MASIFTPTNFGAALGPYRIDLTDCMGDSVSVINANTNYLASYTAAVSSTASSQINNLTTLRTEVQTLSTWTDINLNDTTFFDVSGSIYRVFLYDNIIAASNLTTSTNPAVFYIGGQTREDLVWIAHSGVTSHIKYNSKTIYRINGAVYPTMVVQRIQRRPI